MTKSRRATNHQPPTQPNQQISLCKFSTLLSPPGEKPVVAFGRNKKAQLATKTVFAIAQQHANHFREAWKYVHTHTPHARTHAQNRFYAAASATAVFH